MLHFTYFNIQTIVWGIKPTKINASKQWRFKAPRHKRQTKSTWKLSSVYDHHGLQYKLWNVLILIKWISLWMMPWGRASLTQLVLLPMVVIHTSNIRVWLFVPTHIGIYILKYVKSTPFPQFCQSTCILVVLFFWRFSILWKHMIGTIDHNMHVYKNQYKITYYNRGRILPAKCYNSTLISGADKTLILHPSRCM